jgi:hypothetical protein
MRRATIAIAGCVLAAAPTGAFAHAGASSTPGGSKFASSPASIASIACRSDCVNRRAARPGSLVRLTGRSMARVRSVTFLGGPGGADDVVTGVARARATSVDVRVPEKAVSGRLRTRNDDNVPSRPSGATLRITAPARAPTPAAPAPDPGASRPVGRPDRDTSDRLDAHVESRTVFHGSGRSASFRYVVVGDAPLEVVVEVVRVATGQSVQRWTPGSVAPGVPQQVEWDGRSGRTAAPVGRYEFRVFGVAATAADADGEPPLVADSFRLLSYMFPVRGRYDFGQSMARFGASRGGRSHQGQDVFAPCGTPLVAARGGVVRWKARHARAGNYLVIAGEGGRADHAYMHLQAPALVEKGQRVLTGQVIGHVGQTGRASGCHLHFEMWTAPGWYEGGRPLDPLGHLRVWGAQSAATAGPSAPAALRRR